MNTITAISYSFLSGNILSGAEGRYDERASADCYAEMLRAAFRKEFPEADIEVDYQMAEGSGGGVVVTLSNGVTLNESDRGEPEDVEAIATRVWESFDWAVGACDDVEFINCTVEDIRELDILDDIQADPPKSVEFVGTYEHPGHPGSNDWAVRLYSIEVRGGGTVRVLGTNGESVWDESPEFNEMVEAYSITL